MVHRPLYVRRSRRFDLLNLILNLRKTREFLEFEKFSWIWEFDLENLISQISSVCWESCMYFVSWHEACHHCCVSYTECWQYITVLYILSQKSTFSIWKTSFYTYLFHICWCCLLLKHTHINLLYQCRNFLHKHLQSLIKNQF